MNRTLRIAAAFAAVLSFAPALYADDELPLPEFVPEAAAPAALAAVPGDLWFSAPAPAFDLGPAPSLDMAFEPVLAFAQAAATDASSAPAVSEAEEQELKGVLNNPHYRDSLRLNRQAQDAFDYGDYDAAAQYAAQAAEAARLSDEYVAQKLKALEVEKALAAAKAKLDWAASIGAVKTYAAQWAAASKAYADALAARDAGDYDAALRLAASVGDALASVKAIPPLPAKYKVRPWSETKDCFWTIAAYPWVYANPGKWKVLYEANKAKLPRPDNPNLLRVGTVIIIPSLRGETREGLWEAGKTYQALPKQ